MTPRALIFDFDGVLVNTEPLHMRAWIDVLAALKISFTQKDYDDRYIGLNDRDFLKKIFDEKKHRLTPRLREDLIAQKEAKTRAALSKKIPLIDGADAFLKKSAEKYPMALVTGALPGEVYFILETVGWRKFFPIIVTSADVTKGKPNPEGFLKAFKKLSQIKNWTPPLAAKDCLVFEDSQNGIHAAKNAGMPCQVVKGILT